ncbi:M23 family metallopeptidase [Blastococcus sp. SYSU D00695]
MSQLHHDPVLDEAAVPAPGSGTPLDGPREASSGRPAAARAEVLPTIPAQRPGGAAPTRGTGGAARPSVRSVAARAARTARRATARAGSWTAAGARAAAARRPRPVAAALPQESRLTEAGDLADLSGLAEATALAGLAEITPPETAPTPAAEPEVVEPRVADAEVAEAEVTDAEAAEAEERCTVPVVTAGRGRHRALVRRRPALCVAAALVTAAGLGVVTGSDTPAQAESAPPVSESVSVARALGIEGSVPPAPAGVDTQRLGEIASSRAARDLDRFTAALAQNEADQAAAAAIAEAARPDAVLPVQGARLTSGFGARWGTLHAGIDLAAPMRTPEYAAMDGVVLEAGPASGFGLAVYIQHHNGDVTVYGHMDEILVQPGQVVRAGDTIALLGNRGQSTGPHLHFEVHVGGLDGQKVDPIPWLRERGVQI